MRHVSFARVRLPGLLVGFTMSSVPPRLVAAPVAPPMTDSEFKSQLGRHDEFLAGLKSPAGRTKASRHPDIARAVAGVDSAFRAARAAFGANDSETYHRVLVAVRQAVGAWSSVDGQHGDVTWRAAGN
jgi:hypothetical protein